MENQSLKISSSPHVRSKDTTSDIMFDVLIALVPATVVGLYNFGVHAAILVAVCILSCVVFEAVYQKCMKKKVTVLDFSAAVTGLLLALNLPPELPIPMAIIGCAFAIIVVKQLFGGLGQNFMNPALAARCFLLLSFSKQMTSFVYDGVTTATPLTLLKQDETVNLKDMFLGFTGGTIGETSVVALLIGAIYLLIRRVISPKIPLIYIGTFTVAIVIYALATGRPVADYTLAHLCGGGLMLGAWFMATDYVTSPITSAGKVIYGIVLGLLTFVLRIFGSGAEGVSYAIIISNILVPLIERVTAPKAFGEGAELLDKNGKKKPKPEDKTDGANVSKSASESVSEVSTAAEGAQNEAQPVTKEKMDGKGIFKAIAAIFVITVVMGAALGVVYNVTKDPIDQANEKAKQEAYAEVFADADEYRVLTDDEVGGYDNWNDMLHNAGYTSDTLDEVCFALKDDSVVGVIVTVTNSDGYGGDIQMVMGVSADLEVTGLEFLSISETVGLGMKATEDEFKNQFVGLSITKVLTYTKTGKSAENEIDALSGATITTSAVTDGANAAAYAASVVYTMLGGAQ
jgi:RnfABCDGE-type electron transport complex D subunit/RnfABCDGE-type electron transport complex G subunit